MISKKRLAWIDALNIVACAGVLLLHSTNSQVHHFSGTPSYEWFVGLFTHSFFLWPVNVFFMISGFTLIRSSTNVYNSEMGGWNYFIHEGSNDLAFHFWHGIYYICLNTWFPFTWKARLWKHGPILLKNLCCLISTVSCGSSYLYYSFIFQCLSFQSLYSMPTEVFCDFFLLLGLCWDAFLPWSFPLR